jgi:hypothetical protein
LVSREELDGCTLMKIDEDLISKRNLAYKLAGIRETKE